MARRSWFLWLCGGIAVLGVIGLIGWEAGPGPAGAASAPPAIETAGYVTEGRMACRTEDGLREATRAAHAKDVKRFTSIPGCALTKPGLKVEVVDHGAAISQVRIFSNDGSAAVLFTGNGNLARREPQAADQHD